MVKWLGVVILAGLSSGAEGFDAPFGARAFVDPDHPPPYRPLDSRESAQVILGQSVFETQWVAAGMPSITGRVGLGPLFNATSCNACHSGGQRGQGPAGDGPVPTALVIQLESPSVEAAAESSGDPIYGRVFNTLAQDGVRAEGTVTVKYTEIYGYYYPFGGRWSLRVPHYQLSGLHYGPLAADTVIKPRLAPVLFGAGLLEAVPDSAIIETAHRQSDGRLSGTPAWHSRQGVRMLGRFGWQGGAVSIRDQTTKAFALEMGLTSNDQPSDDCTPAEADCRRPRNGDPPEVSETLVDAVTTFVRTLAVPESPQATKNSSVGSELFDSIGCTACHQARLPIEMPGVVGTTVSGTIAAYTDLRLHDLGVEMADENASGTKVGSRWRTAPLWGMGYRLKAQDHPTFLHDGRARSIEEAILWHSGEAAYAKGRFMDLGPRAREALQRWLATL